MSAVGTIISTGLTVIVYVLILVSVYRIFQISTDISEMKELLKDIRRNTAPAEPRTPLDAVSRPESPEALVRAVHSASYQELTDTLTEPSRQERE